MKSQARRATRPDLWWAGLLAMIVSALIVTGTTWAAFVLLLAMAAQ